MAADVKPTTEDDGRGRALAVLSAAIVVGALLRFHGLGALAYYYDELYAVRIHGLGLRNLAGVVARTAFYDVHPPFYYLAAFFWTAFAGLSEGAVRALSALAGVATIPLAYLLGRDLSNRRVGALGALALALLPVHFYYSRDARMYSLLALAGALSTWLLVRMARGDRRGWLLPAWLVATTATALTHYFGVIHVMAEFAALALRGRRGLRGLPGWLALFAVPGALFVPFALFAQYQGKHNEVSYLGSGAAVYVDLFAWLGGAHQRLPFAPLWTLPLVALAAAGVRAAWREGPPPPAEPFAPPPAAPRLERALWVLAALGAFAAAAGVFVVRNRLADRIAEVEMGRGEAEAIAILQGRTATVATFLGGAAAGVAALLMAFRDPLQRRLARWLPERPADGSVDPATSLARLSLVVILTPVAFALLAGLAGRPLVLVRNFLCAAPFIALLAARGLLALPRPAGAGLGLAAAAVALLVAVRVGALPGAGDEALRPWLMHTYYDWRRVEPMARAEPEAPLVAVQHYATDAAIHYRGRHPVVRVRAAGSGLVVGQVRADDEGGGAGDVREGEPFRPELLPRLFLLDLGGGVAHDGGASRRLLDAVRAGHRCSVAGTIPGGVTVHDCAATEAVALSAR